MDLERRGIPGGFVASEEFVEAASAQAKSLGFDPHKVFVPHPIQDRTDEEMQQLAEHAFEEVLGLILER
jgi:alkanesulfonate monooxygenase SsuD/methylene tetrahydromethanopterin reductase-like flavin-dependent oxidoreductase (luciferase family)